jgi:chlorophyll synthase
MARTEPLAAPLPLPAPRAVLELLKPITWFAPMWGFACGIVCSGQPLGPRLPMIVAGIALCGPLVCGTSQAANDWFDRHVDAINEPGRPIPSGRVPGRSGLAIALIWTLLSLLTAAALGMWTFGAAILGLVLAWAYSAPPVRLKLNGWWGNAACGLCYEGLSWFTGAAIMAGTAPNARVVTLALLYSLGAHGIMTLNDFKSVEGDRRMGVRSLPVQLGVDRAARLACAVMAGPQIVVVALLTAWGMWLAAGAVALLLLVQCALMARLLSRPRERAPWYNATGTTLYVIGMMVCAFAVRP